jgi:hypothetical protein
MVRKILFRLAAFLLAFLVSALPGLPQAHCGLVHGRMIDGGGPLFLDECFYGSQWIVRAVEGYSDAAKAEAVFAERIRTASIVYQQNEKVDQSGKRIGRRAVVRLRLPQTGQSFTSILWTDENRIVSIDSTLHYYALLAEWIDDK